MFLAVLAVQHAGGSVCVPVDRVTRALVRVDRSGRRKLNPVMLPRSAVASAERQSVAGLVLTTVALLAARGGRSLPDHQLTRTKRWFQRLAPALPHSIAAHLA